MIMAVVDKEEKSSRTFYHNSDFDELFKSLEKEGALALTPNADAAFIGLAYALNRGLEGEEIPKSKRSASIREWAIKSHREQLMKMVAVIEKKSTSVLEDWSLIYDICIRYANAGLSAMDEDMNLRSSPNALHKLVQLAISSAEEASD